MGEVVVIAAVSALDAGLLAAAVALLGRPQPARRLLAHLIGGMGFSVIIGLLIVLALHGSSVLRALDLWSRAVIGVAVGELLIFIAIAVASGRRMQWHPRRTRKRNADHSPRHSLPDQAPSMTPCGSRGLLVASTARRPRNTYGLALLAKLNAPPSGVLMPDRTRSLTEKLDAWMTASRDAAKRIQGQDPRLR